MSGDGELFVLHDDDAKRLFNRPDVTNVEDLTIAELQAMPYDMTDASAEEAPNSCSQRQQHQPHHRAPREHRSQL